MIVWFTSKTELIQEEEKRSKQNIQWERIKTYQIMKWSRGDHKTIMVGFGLSTRDLYDN